MLLRQAIGHRRLLLPDEDTLFLLLSQIRFAKSIDPAHNLVDGGLSFGRGCLRFLFLFLETLLKIGNPITCLLAPFRHVLRYRNCARRCLFCWAFR